jgi:hypothetical protein
MVRNSHRGQAPADRPSRLWATPTVTEYAGKAQSHIVVERRQESLSVFAVENLKTSVDHRARSQRPGDEE